MKDLFTISEFASLRHVNVNSIRYYEKIGFLKPAYTDPDSNYRYYSREQLSELDSIILCIDMGIPVKDLKKYLTDDGFIDKKGLYKIGLKAMEASMEKIRLTKMRTESMLEFMESNEQYKDREGIYDHLTPARSLIYREYAGDFSDKLDLEAHCNALHKYCVEKGFYPLLPGGFIYHFRDRIRHCYLFHIVDVPENAPKEERLISLPEMNCRCLQADVITGADILGIIKENFEYHDPLTIMMMNMQMTKFKTGRTHSEIRVLPEEISSTLFL